ncbi:unnamed protein product [Oikopleura dioica]|uniref:Transcription elongation factor n=1 Tax=Oikopleura dioica TaxID=34765 RepID=E4WR07_OIKDI|nr:unnamed protein product [Oikopleura dioica]
MPLEELKRYASQVKKLCDKEKYGDAVDLLNALKEEKITKELLESSKIGHVVNALRKGAQTSGHAEIAAQSKSLIKQWKAQMAQNAGGGDNGAPAKVQKTESSSQKREKEKEKTSDSKDDFSLGASIQPTADPVRNKSRELLQKALLVDKDKFNPQFVSLMAAKIEEAIYNFHGNSSSDTKYRNKIRSRYSNLKDAKNPDLRDSVMTGVISPDKLASMKPEEMASKQLQELRKKFTKEAINDHQMAQNEGTQTDMFSCGKCKSKKCTYTQLQTRSADEPMTTFVYCMACGNRWKFC